MVLVLTLTELSLSPTVSESTRVSLDGMEPRVTLFLKGFLPFFNIPLLSLASQSGLAGTLAWCSQARTDFCLNKGADGPLGSLCRPVEMELYGLMTKVLELAGAGGEMFDMGVSGQGVEGGGWGTA